MSTFLSHSAFYAAQTTTVQTVKPTSGALCGYYIYNPNSSVAYVQFFDVASGTTVTLNTTVPTLSIGIPATAAANLFDGTGLEFKNGLKLAATTTATGLTAPSTGLDINVLFR
jgi:hypothetical protein